MTIEQSIISLVEVEPHSTFDISSALDLTMDEARKLTAKLQKAGRIRRSNFMWVAVPDDRE